MRHIARDIRYAVRLLVKQPAFSLVAVLVLALGIGANTAVFTLVNVLLFKPMVGDGLRDAVGIYSRDSTRPDSYRSFSYPTFVDVRDSHQLFDAVMAHAQTLVGITEGDSTRRAFAVVASANYFDTLGVRLAAGRPFTADEERPDSHRTVVIVNDRIWRLTGRDPGFIGQTLRVNGRDFTVVGVAPAGFTGTSIVLSPDLWFPLGVHEYVTSDALRDGRPGSLADRDNPALMLVGRLRPGLTPDSAQPLLDGLAASLEATAPAVYRNQSLLVRPLPRNSVSTAPRDDSEVAVAGAILLAMSSVVLLIACLNLANMLLARGTSRRREVAIRLALGAGRTRIVGQLLTEGFVLAVLGGALGVVLAGWAARALVATLTTLLPFPVDFNLSPDIRVLAATAAFCGVSTLLFGLGPALKVTRPDVVPDLKEQPSSNRGPKWSRRFNGRNALVVCQLALSLVLLVASGLFVRGAMRAATVDPGFSLDRGLVAGIDPGLVGYEETRGRRVFREVLARVRTLPGVESASLASLVPLGDISMSRRVMRPGGETDGAGDRDSPAGVRATTNIVSSSYFQSLGLPILRGRDFSLAEEEAAGGARVAIINDVLARQLFAGEDPLGRQIEFGRASGTDEVERFEVVGLVPGVRHRLFERGLSPHVYLPVGQHYQSMMNLHVRTAAGGDGAETTMLGAVRRALREVDDRLPVLSLQTLRAHRDRSASVWLVVTASRLFVTFGLLALVLVVVGVYGVKAYVVARRTREIGVRMALGADRRDVFRLVMGESARLTAVGVSLGLVLSVAAGQVIGSLLFEVDPVDPLVFALASLVLVGASSAAAFLPARRATRIVPIRALRSE